MNLVPNFLPAGFKHVPSNMLFAVSRDGRVLNAMTHLSVKTYTDHDGVVLVTFYTYKRSEGKNEQVVIAVQDLIDEAFGIEWADIPGYPAYKISRDGLTVVNKSTKKSVPIYQETVPIFKSGRDLIPDVWLIEELLKLAFPEKENVPETPRRRVARNGTQILRGVSTASDRNAHNRLMFLPDGAPQILLNTDVWDIQWEKDFDLLNNVKEFKAKKEARLTNRSKTITVNNAAVAREALMQIQRTKGRHYPGPLRDQTIWDLIDHLVEELTEPEESSNSLSKQ